MNIFKKSATLAMIVMVCSLNAQNHTDAKTEKRIANLIKQMTLEEKVSLLHGNSKFYVSGIKRLGIPEFALSDGPHGVRAEMNLHNWKYAGWTTDSATCSPPGTSLAASWNPDLRNNFV